jgi:hypothetical protein
MLRFITLACLAIRGNQHAAASRFKNNALLEPARPDGLPLFYADVTFKNGCGVLPLTRIFGESGCGRGFCVSPPIPAALVSI